MKRVLKMLLLVFFLIIIYVYTLLIESIPNELVIFEGENISMKTLLGVTIKDKNNQTIEVSSNNGNSLSNETGKKSLEVSLFNNILLKNVDVSVLPKATVIPVGKIAGLKLHTNGVLVVGMSEIEGQDKKRHKPYENTGIEEGDTIIKINETEIGSTNQLIETVNLSKGNSIQVKFIHEEVGHLLGIDGHSSRVADVMYSETSYENINITDIDTNELINIASGEFITTRVLNITKGESGEPGKIQGTIENQQNIGTISKNSKFGIYGRVDNLSSLNVDTSKKMEVALRNEIQLGKATILCSLDNQKPQEYEIEIQKIYTENNYDNKSMQIKVTDQKLIEKTGGIIQGMSGSPIIQNGKFVGAVTHVLVNNPQEGYAVFGDIMLKQSKSVQQ